MRIIDKYGGNTNATAVELTPQEIINLPYFLPGNPPTNSGETIGEGIMRAVWRNTIALVGDKLDFKQFKHYQMMEVNDRLVLLLLREFPKIMAPPGGRA